MEFLKNLKLHYIVRNVYNLQIILVIYLPMSLLGYDKNSVIRSIFSQQRMILLYFVGGA